MKVRYTGPHPIHLSFRPKIDEPGEVWEIQPGEEIDLPHVPQLPHFAAVKEKKGADS